MRSKSQWTPGGIVLWLIAAIIATLVVCSETAPDEVAPPKGHQIDFEVEALE